MMKLSYALDIKRKDVVAFVGAGGKTSAMFRLADELVAQGWRVLSTTTTRLAEEEMGRAPHRIEFGHIARPPATLAEHIKRHKHIFVFSKREPDQKVRGFSPAWLDANLADIPVVDTVLVEADGSRRLPLKAPLPNEPAIPSSATVIVPVVGLSALGLPLNAQTVYGADQIENLIGYPLESPITSQFIAAILISPQLGLKNVPADARVIPLLNQVTAESLATARKIAGDVLTDAHIERVLIGAVQDDEPIWEIRRRIGVIVLAAGQSNRMKKPKLLLPWGDATIIRQVCQQVCAAALHEVVVVVGQYHDAIQEQVSDLPLRVIQNPDYVQGEMLSSLKVGLDAIWHSCDACLVVLGDQPTIQQSVISAVVEAFNQGAGRLVAPSYNQRRGHPLLIDKTFWQAIKDLPQNKAPRDMLRAHENEIVHIVVDTDSILQDIDTPEDYDRMRQMAGSW